MGAIEHYSCAILGFVAAVALVTVAYPLLVAATRPLFLLSSTVLVVVLAATWFLTWLGLEVLWAFQAERRRQRS